MTFLRVLIVDDHEAARRGLRSLLSSRPDCLVCGEAVDGLDGVQKAKELRPDVILMDISMPRMNGLDATRVLRKDLPESKIVIVSQNDPAIVKVQARDVDAAAYISKIDVGQKLFPMLDRMFDKQACNRVLEGTKSQPGEQDSSASGWIAGRGEMARLIRERDWSQTSLGPLDSWPQSLKIAVNLMLNSRHPMWVGWGREMPFLYNDAYISVLGSAKHPTALGLPARDVWKEIWDICGPLAEKVFERGEATFVDDVRFFMDRGGFLEENYYSFSYNPIYDEFGRIAGLFCPNTDTTPKILNARRLRTLSELAAKAFVEHSAKGATSSSFVTLAKNPDDIPFALLYLLDGDGRHAFLEQTTGVSLEVERVCPGRIDPEEQSEESLFWRMTEVLGTGAPAIVSLKNFSSAPVGLAGQPLEQAIVLTVTSGRQDRPIGILIAGVNPTRKLDREYQTFYELLAGQVATAIQNARHVEEDRKRAEALAEIDRAKTVFFNNVSHEFRTPLTLMLGPVEELLSRSHTDLSPSSKNQLELVNRNGSRLLRLVNTLLDFSRIEAGRMEVVYQPTNLSEFTAELASVFRSATEKAGLRLELDCPKLDEPVFVDRDMWEKIVLNLISNAFKFTFEGEIAVSLVQTGGSVEFRVRDTGVGIPANELPRLFDRFHRVQNTRSRTHEGSGIGLALVHELVKLHYGDVRVESAPGIGSTFIVRLPLGSSHLPVDGIGGARGLASTAVGATPFLEEALGWLPDAGQTSSREELPTGLELMQVPCPPLSANGEASPKRPRVVIADDNADMRSYLVRLLAERYDVEAVANGQAALEIVRKRKPDLILSDVMMPELDGFGLLRELRSDPGTKTIPIILLSARAGEESRVEGMERGADDYLIKPFSARELLARVQTHLEMARVRQHNEEALLQRTQQFETLLNEAPLGVYLVDQNFRVRAMNPTALRAFGNTPELIGCDFGEVIHARWPENYADQIVERFRHTLESGEPHFEPERAEDRADSGVREIYEWQINRIRLPEGENGVVCYFREISRQVLAREAIERSEERLRLATQAAHSGTWDCDLATRQIISSPELQELFGLFPGVTRFHSDEWRRVIDPEDLKAVDRALEKAIENHDEFHVEFRVNRAAGQVRWVESLAQIFYDHSGKAVRIVGVSTDITERKRIEERERRITAEAMAATAKFRAVFEQSSVFAGILSLDGIVLDVNRLCLEACGYREDEVLGRSLSGKPRGGEGPRKYKGKFGRVRFRLLEEFRTAKPFLTTGRMELSTSWISRFIPFWTITDK